MSTSPLRERMAKLTFGKGSRLRLYRQFERLLGNNVTVVQALETLYKRASNKGKNPNNGRALMLRSWQQAYGSWANASLARAMEGWIPQQEQMLLEAGEASGEIVQAFKRAADLTIKTGKMKAAIVGGAIYPVVLVMVIVFMLWGFGVEIVPAFTEILPPERWTGAASQAYGVSTFVRDWVLFILIAFFGFCALYMTTVASWTGNVRKYFDKIPPWSMYRMWQGSSFLLSLAALLRAGVSLNEALERIQRLSNPYLSERIEATLYYINTGRNLGEALDDTGFKFPEEDIIQDIAVLAGLNGFEDSMETLADEWLEDGLKTVQSQASTMNTLMLFIITAVIGWMGKAIFDLQQQIADAANRF